MNKVLVSAILAVCVGAGASAHAAASTDNTSRANKNECVFSRTIYDFKPLDRDKIVIWAPTRSKAYLVELSMPMPELKFANRIAFVDRNHDGMLCGYGMDRIVVADSSVAFRTPATIMSMQRLDAAALAQLEQQYDVRLTRKKVAEAPSGTAQEQPQDNPGNN
jgi:Family of unknown function (DUF6491)